MSIAPGGPQPVRPLGSECSGGLCSRISRVVRLCRGFFLAFVVYRINRRYRIFDLLIVPGGDLLRERACAAEI
eukprot:scaffold116046_cov67-Phaeocystis_antarctica.AAC.2